MGGIQSGLHYPIDESGKHLSEFYIWLGKIGIVESEYIDTPLHTFLGKILESNSSMDCGVSVQMFALWLVEQRHPQRFRVIDLPDLANIYSMGQHVFLSKLLANISLPSKQFDYDEPFSHTISLDAGRFGAFCYMTCFLMTEYVQRFNGYGMQWSYNWGFHCFKVGTDFPFLDVAPSSYIVFTTVGWQTMTEDELMAKYRKWVKEDVEKVSRIEKTAYGYLKLIESALEEKGFDPYKPIFSSINTRVISPLMLAMLKPNSEMDQCNELKKMCGMFSNSISPYLGQNSVYEYHMDPMYKHYFAPGMGQNSVYECHMDPMYKHYIEKGIFKESQYIIEKRQKKQQFFQIKRQNQTTRWNQPTHSKMPIRRKF